MKCFNLWCDNKQRVQVAENIAKAYSNSSAKKAIQIEALQEEIIKRDSDALKFAEEKMAEIARLTLENETLKKQLQAKKK